MAVALLHLDLDEVEMDMMHFFTNMNKAEGIIFVLVTPTKRT